MRQLQPPPKSAIAPLQPMTGCKIYGVASNRGQMWGNEKPGDLSGSDPLLRQSGTPQPNNYMLKILFPFVWHAPNKSSQTEGRFS